MALLLKWPFSFALETPLVTSFSFGIVEYWGSGNLEAICLWQSADEYTLIVPADRPWCASDKIRERSNNYCWDS